MSQVLNINSDQFQSEVASSSIPVLVDFWAPWCGPCLAMAPVLDQISDQFKDKVKVVKINVDEPQNQSLAIEQQIYSIPNLKLFKDGKVIKEFVGFRPAEMFVSELQSSLV